MASFNKEAEREFVNELDSFSEKKQPSFAPGENGKFASRYTSAVGEDANSAGFLKKTAHFMDAGKRAVEALKPEKNEAAVSNVDDKAILAAAVLHEKFNDEKQRFAEISAEKKNEIKHLQKSIRSEQQILANGKFLDTRAEFTDRGGGFLDKYRDAFKDKRLNEFSGMKDAGGWNGNSLAKAPYGKSRAQPDGRFSETTVKSDGNKGKKSVSSYFSDKSKESGSHSSSGMSAREKLDLKKSERKSAKKAKNKAVRKAAATAAVASMLRAKKEMQNDAAGMNPSGDLLKDGSGMLRAVANGIKAAIENKAKALVIKAASMIMAGLMNVVAAAMPLIVMVVIVIMIMTSFMSVFTDSSSIPEGDGHVYSSLSETEIDGIIENLYETMPDIMDSRRESLLRYSLSKVGCAYDQAMHWRLDVDVFDCSSLAYLAYRDVGIDISNGGIYSAAEICHKAASSGSIAYGDLKPGDLIFYGGSDNGRYLGIYHVAIYVGEGKMVEARGRSSGVVYCDARTGNVVGYSRYM